ncbi:MAG: hypothetical protein ABJN34_02965 [Litoreibacter sp.]|uniref:hypothetical protein n=1 Tax=Litoreibacter sp. TaxID=1969459 RepID=UPI00329848C6
MTLPSTPILHPARPLALNAGAAASGMPHNPISDTHAADTAQLMSTPLTDRLPALPFWGR